MSDKSLNLIIINAKKGSQTAYRDLLNLYWGDVYRFILSKCSNDYQAEDITIKAFSKAFDKIATFDENKSFRNWILAISSNLYIDHLRAEKRKIETVFVKKETVVTIVDVTPTPEDKLIQEQHLAQLLAYIKQLKPHYREVINLRYFQELTYREIAEELDESLSNVKVKLLRARKLLNEIIKKK
jgi:RNA polymerase sigma-70 factor (ECF subfamily)